MADYLKRVKGMPMIEGAYWWPTRFNLTSHLSDPSYRLEFFVTHKIARCIDPRDETKQIFCWKFNYAFDFLHKIMVTYKEKTTKDFWEMLKEVNFTLTVDDYIIRASIDHLFLFFDQKVAFDYPGREKIPIILPIKDTARILTPNSKLNLDWLTFINRAFLKHSQAQSGDEEILIEDSEIFAKSLELIEGTAPRIMSDVQMLGFLFGYQHMYVTYPFNRIDSYKRGTRKDYQRFEQCISQLEVNCGPGLIGLYARKLFIKKDHDAAKSFIREAIDDVINEISLADDLDEIMKNQINERLQKVAIIAGYPKETVDVDNMIEMYSELELDGSEGILETSIKTIQYNNRLDNEPKSSWFFTVNELSHLNNLKYLSMENLLYVPIEYVQYPYYDANRSRFFNTATLYTEVVQSVNEGIKEFIKTRFNISYQLDYDSIQLGFKNYVNWEKSRNGTEKRLPGFLLTNQQMYWLSLANTYYMKYHTNVPFFQLEALKLQFTYFHVWFKAREEFRKAFNCTELNENEKSQFAIFQEKFNKVFRRN